MRVPDSSPLPQPGVGQPPTLRPRERQMAGKSSTLLPPEPSSRERIQARRMNAPLSTSGLNLWGFEHYLQASLIQHWWRSQRRPGSKMLARRLNRCMRAQTNEERIRRLRQSLPDRPMRKHAPHKPQKQYRPRFPLIISEDCLWPLVETDK